MRVAGGRGEYRVRETVMGKAVLRREDIIKVGGIGARRPWGRSGTGHGRAVGSEGVWVDVLHAVLADRWGLLERVADPGRVRLRNLGRRRGGQGRGWGRGLPGRGERVLVVGGSGSVNAGLVEELVELLDRLAGGSVVLDCDF